MLAREIPHKGGRTFGYRISDGRSTLTYMPDHCPTTLGPGEDGFGEYHPAALELARGADLLLHDAQLFPEELAAEAELRARGRRLRGRARPARRRPLGRALPPSPRPHRRGARRARTAVGRWEHARGRCRGRGHRAGDIGDRLQALQQVLTPGHQTRGIKPSSAGRCAGSSAPPRASSPPATPARSPAARGSPAAARSARRRPLCCA